MNVRMSLFPALLSGAMTLGSLWSRVNSSEQLTPQLQVAITCFLIRNVLSLMGCFVQDPKNKRILQAMRRSLSLLERATLILLVSR